LIGQVVIKTAGVGTFNGSPKITAITDTTNFTVEANHTSSGAVTFKTGTATNFTADGGGIVLKGDTDKSIIWDDLTGWNIAGKGTSMGSNQVLYLDGSVYIGSTTSSATSALQIDANQITSGNGLLLSGNAYVGSSNRGLLDVRSTSTARATNSSLIGVNSSGAVDTSVISRGLSSSVTNSGTNTTNIGFYSNASGAATNNYSFYGNAGDIYNAGSAYIGSTVFGYNGSFGNNLRVLGTSTLEAVTGTTGSFSSNLNVGGTSTLAAVTGTTGSFSSNLNVGGTSTLAAVTGTTGSFSGAVTGANGSFSSGAVSSFNSYTGSTVYGFNGSFANNLRVVGTSTLAAVTGTTGSFSSTLNVGGTSTFTGNSTFAGDIAVNGGDVFLPSTGTIGYYGSAAQQTLNIATFNATGTNSKTINIGTGFTGSAGGGQTATTNVNVGYAGSGTTTIHSPSTAVSGNLTVSGGRITLANGSPSSTAATISYNTNDLYWGNGTSAIQATPIRKLYATTVTGTSGSYSLDSVDALSTTRYFLVLPRSIGTSNTIVIRIRNPLDTTTIDTSTAITAPGPIVFRVGTTYDALSGIYEVRGYANGNLMQVDDATGNHELNIVKVHMSGSGFTIYEIFSN
jgi:hypothetical protein